MEYGNIHASSPFGPSYFMIFLMQTVNTDQPVWGSLVNQSNSLDHTFFEQVL